MPSQTTVSSWPLLRASIKELFPSLTVNTPKIVKDQTALKYRLSSTYLEATAHEK